MAIRRIKNYMLLMSLLVLSCSNDETPPKELQPGEGPIADGCPNGQYDEWKTSEYVLPYPVGKSYVVTLSHCGGSFHSEGEPDEYGVDFAMDIGETITAARAGQVVYVEESGVDGEFPNNLVIIEHEDGTFAQYMHLTKNGALVDVGNQVIQGNKIGLSGNTGLAGFPHLHFIITQAGSYNYPYTSIPTTFSNTLSNERSLAKGQRYPAYGYE
ncbi:M23 family metallopeptidase [Maribacter halichondriae]|uniref:M23 family metallopeptidase n=1 Tax=Maribacter halichondriae TaxID=2980554 RepID=UPI0023595741|nr:M23 family metallopeptidase [Maribacter sp. Hal144]